MHAQNWSENSRICILLYDSLSSLNLNIFTFLEPSQITMYISTLHYDYSVRSYMVI
jgi:hypothetical protein